MNALTPFFQLRNNMTCMFTRQQQNMYSSKDLLSPRNLRMICRFHSRTINNWRKSSYATWRSFHHVRRLTLHVRVGLCFNYIRLEKFLSCEMAYNITWTCRTCTQSFFPCSCAGHDFCFLLQARTQQLLDLGKDIAHCAISLHLNYRNQKQKKGLKVRTRTCIQGR